MLFLEEILGIFFVCLGSKNNFLGGRQIIIFFNCYQNLF